MGSLDSDDAAKADEKPQHRVQITEAFYLGLYEVTQGQYRQVMGRNPSVFEGPGVDVPAERVSWNDAQEFCRQLSALPAERAAGRLYRLPTEAEWEYACRAGSTGVYPFGDTAAALDEYAWSSANAEKRTHPVGQKTANAWGLYDMLGNVWEWCQDAYDPDEGYYERFEGRLAVDPAGPLGASKRVTRGGCYHGNPRPLRSASRNAILLGYTGGCFGFRLAGSVPFPESEARSPQPSGVGTPPRQVRWRKLRRASRPWNQRRSKPCRFTSSATVFGRSRPPVMRTCHR